MNEGKEGCSFTAPDTETNASKTGRAPRFDFETRNACPLDPGIFGCSVEKLQQPLLKRPFAVCITKSEHIASGILPVAHVV